MKTGTHPMRTRLRLFLEWGITFREPYSIPEKRPVLLPMPASRSWNWRSCAATTRGK